jgi:Proteasome subunit
VSPEALHGTVNVFLANRNGLVVATDSRLSYKGERRGLGKKLFKIDDHSVCAIAGFYSDPGPDVDLRYPIATTVPGIVDDYINLNSSISTYSIEAKLDGLSEALIVSLEFVENMNIAAGQHPSPSVSQITVAGYDREVLKIAHLDLVPSLEDNNAVYREKNLSVDTVGQDFFWKLAAIEDVGRAMLSPSNPLIATNPAVAFTSAL